MGIQHKVTWHARLGYIVGLKAVGKGGGDVTEEGSEVPGYLLSIRSSH